ncbi:unnamed protein product [Gadus morhua 'NCC']
MKLSSALLLLTSAVLGVRPSSAQGEPQYFEVGTPLTLEPDVSTVKKPVNSIRWKYGTSLVVDWDQSGHTYYGSFRGRTTLDPDTLRLDIDRLTLADGGQFSLETNLGTVGTDEVKVIKSPPKPRIKTQPLVCDVTCALKCTADLQDLGPVTYEWKKDEGEWTKGDELKGMNESKTSEKFSCRLKTHVRTSEASEPFLNPLKPPKPPGPPLAPGVIAAIVITVLLFAVVAAIIAVVFMLTQRHAPSRAQSEHCERQERVEASAPPPDDGMDLQGRRGLNEAMNTFVDFMYSYMY